MKSGIVLALGAGVSVASRLPSWPQLLERLAADVSAQSHQLDFRQLTTQGLTLPVIASILEEFSSGREEFVERVRTALYASFPFFPEGVSKSNRREFGSGKRDSGSGKRDRSDIVKLGGPRRPSDLQPGEVF